MKYHLIALGVTVAIFTIPAVVILAPMLALGIFAPVFVGLVYYATLELARMEGWGE